MEHASSLKTGVMELAGIPTLIKDLCRSQLANASCSFGEADVKRLHRRAYSILLGFDEETTPQVTTLESFWYRLVMLAMPPHGCPLGALSSLLNIGRI